MATQTPTDDKRWLSAAELRELAAAAPESGPPPSPLDRTDETSPRPLAVGVGMALLALLVVAVVLL